MSHISTPKLEGLLDEMQASAMLALSVRTLQAWRTRNNGPPFIRLGRAIRYRHNDLINWINANTVSNAPRPFSGFAKPDVRHVRP